MVHWRFIIETHEASANPISMYLLQWSRMKSMEDVSSAHWTHQDHHGLVLRMVRLDYLGEIR